MAENWYLTIFEGAESKYVEKITQINFFVCHFLILKRQRQIFCCFTMGYTFTDSWSCLTLMGLNFFHMKEKILGHVNIKDGFGILNHFKDMPF